MAGLELLHSSVQSQLKSREDALVCCVHWAIIRQGLRCIGAGEPQAGVDVSALPRSEMLPAEWNASQDSYILRYISADGTLFMLRIVRMENVLAVHFMRVSGHSEDHVGDCMVDVNQHTTEYYRTYSSAFTNRDELEARLVSELLEPVLKPQTSTRPSPLLESGQEQRRAPPVTEPPPQRHDPLRGPPPRHDPLRVGDPLRGLPPGRPHPAGADPGDPFSIGRGDLDPFAGGIGGGMIFDPMRSGVPGRGIDPSAGLPGRLPPGAVPPGARFDPFGPPDLDPSGNPRGPGRPGPDPDHLPPPGYRDMFM